MAEAVKHEAVTPAQQEVDTWLTALDKALTSDKPGDAAALFEPEGFWRDLVSLTWNIHTAEGSEAIAATVSYTHLTLPTILLV